MGCWKDINMWRDLPTWPNMADWNTSPISPDLCINTCNLMNYKYAGLQAGYVEINDQSLTKLKFCININWYVFNLLKEDHAFVVILMVRMVVLLRPTAIRHVMVILAKYVEVDGETAYIRYYLTIVESASHHAPVESVQILCWLENRYF